VDSVSARTVWQKIYGACPAMPSPGNARTVEGRMDSATSEGRNRSQVQCFAGVQNTSGFFQIFGFSGLRNLNITTLACRPEKEK
jgi:hypothetical protein